MPASAVLVAPDLLFQSRIEPVLREHGVIVEVAAAPEKALAAIVGAQLLVIDLQAAGFDTIALIRAAHDRGAKVLAFGRHTDAATLRNAREAGADMAVARSQIAEDLRELIDQLLVGTSGRAPSQQ